jgi:hypothetical protein
MAKGNRMNKSVFLFTCSEDELEAAKQLNLSSVFVGFENLSKVKPIRDILGNTVEVNVSIRVFSKKGAPYLENFNSEPVEAAGKPLPGSPLCPTNEDVRNACLANVKTTLDQSIDGIWLDALTYPSSSGYPEPNLVDTCYCDRCIHKFEDYLGEKIAGTTLEEKVLLIDGSYYIEWIEFKTGVIASMAQEVKDLINASGKKVKLGYFAVPLEDKEFGSAVKRLIGQDFLKLSAIVDITSPMLYHKMLYRDVTWIKEKVDYFSQLETPILPAIQTENLPSDVTVEEFKQALDYTFNKNTFGVIVFFMEDLAKQPDKLELVKNTFN